MTVEQSTTPEARKRKRMATAAPRLANQQAVVSAQEVENTWNDTYPADDEDESLCGESVMDDNDWPLLNDDDNGIYFDWLDEEAEDELEACAHHWRRDQCRVDDLAITLLREDDVSNHHLDVLERRANRENHRDRDPWARFEKDDYAEKRAKEEKPIAFSQVMIDPQNATWSKKELDALDSMDGALAGRIQEGKYGDFFDTIFAAFGGHRDRNMPEHHSKSELLYLARWLLRHASCLGDQRYDMCYASCILFAGKYKDMFDCPFCGEPRALEDNAGMLKPNRVFEYLPLVPRLMTQLHKPARRAEMMYAYHKINGTLPDSYPLAGPFTSFQEKQRPMTDIFNGADFQKAYETTQAMHSEHAIYLGVMVESCKIFRAKKVDGWVITAFLYNLPPHLRHQKENILVLGFIPGPQRTRDLSSFLQPLIDEIAQLKGPSPYTTFGQKVSVHLLTVTGDTQALRSVWQLTEPTQQAPCRICAIPSHTDLPPRPKIQVPKKERRKEPLEPDVAVCHPPPLSGEKKDKAWCRQWIEKIEMAKEEDQQALRDTSGIYGDAALWSIPTLDMTMQSPELIMQTVFMRAVPVFWGCFSGKLITTKTVGDDFLLTKTTVAMMSQELQEAGKTMSRAMGPHPGVFDHLGLVWTARKWQDWVCAYSLVQLSGRLPTHHYKAWKGFVEAMRILQRPAITKEDTAVAQEGINAWLDHFNKHIIRDRQERRYLFTPAVHYLLHYPDITLALGPQYHHWGREARFHVKDIAARDHLIVFPYSNLINRLFFHQALRHIHYWKGEDMQVIWPRQHLNAIVPMHYRHVELYGLRLNARLSQSMRDEVERGYKALVGVDLVPLPHFKEKMMRTNKKHQPKTCKILRLSRMKLLHGDTIASLMHEASEEYQSRGLTRRDEPQRVTHLFAAQDTPTASTPSPSLRYGRALWYGHVLGAPVPFTFVMAQRLVTSVTSDCLAVCTDKTDGLYLEDIRHVRGVAGYLMQGKTRYVVHRV